MYVCMSHCIFVSLKIKYKKKKRKAGAVFSLLNSPCLLKSILVFIEPGGSFLGGGGKEVDGCVRVFKQIWLIDIKPNTFPCVLKRLGRSLQCRRTVKRDDSQPSCHLVLSSPLTIGSRLQHRQSLAAKGSHD